MLYLVSKQMERVLKRIKLKNVTWCLGDTNTAKYGVLWCDKQKRAKRNKPAKIMGIIVDNKVDVYHQLNWCVW